MNYSNINSIIIGCLKDCEKDISTLKYVEGVDFIDIFPRSEEHKAMLDEEAKKIARVIEETERGNFYVFHKPIKTQFGMLKIIKVRKFDETRLPWLAAPDFRVTDYDIFFKTYKNDKRFNFVQKPTYSGLEFKTQNSLIYFLDEPTTEYYNL